MEEATHLAWIIISTETLWRASHCHFNVANALLLTDFQPGILFVIAYLLCAAAIFMNIKSIAFFKTALVRDSITFLHAADGFTALVMGLAIYFQSNFWMMIGILAITKVFLLHLLSRMVTGVKAHSNFEVLLQTTKTFLHHTGSFMFITDPNVALITALWRFTSMNGHAILSMKGHLSDHSFSRGMWAITHARNVVLVGVLLLCAFNSDIRRGFGECVITLVHSASYLWHEC